MRVTAIGLCSILLISSVIFSNGEAAVETNASLQTALEDFFSIYVLNKDRRSAQDKVTLSGNEQRGYVAEFGYWHSLQSKDPVEEVCNAYKWLLFGRGNYGKGAVEAFNQFPTLQQIELKFFDVDTGTKLGKKRAEILPTSRVIPYLKIGVERRSLLAKKVDWKELKNQMAKGNCAELGNRMLDSRWFDENYLRQGK